MSQWHSTHHKPLVDFRLKTWTSAMKCHCLSFDLLNDIIFLMTFIKQLQNVLLCSLNISLTHNSQVQDLTLLEGIFNEFLIFNYLCPITVIYIFVAEVFESY